jgi:hypothetical protein
MRQLHHVRTRIGGVQGGQGNRLKGSVSGEPRCRLCALITLRAVHSDLEFAAPRDADLPDEGRAYVEHVATPDSLRERSGGSQASSELAMARASALVLRRDGDGAQPEKTESYSAISIAM